MNLKKIQKKRQGEIHLVSQINDRTILSWKASRTL